MDKIIDWFFGKDKRKDTPPPTTTTSLLDTVNKQFEVQQGQKYIVPTIELEPKTPGQIVDAQIKDRAKNSVISKPQAPGYRSANPYGVSGPAPHKTPQNVSSVVTGA